MINFSKSMAATSANFSFSVDPTMATTANQSYMSKPSFSNSKPSLN